MKLPTIAIIEYAIIPTTTPAIPQIKADFAVVSLSAWPPAVKNKIPAVTKQITAIPANTAHTGPRRLAIILLILEAVTPVGFGKLSASAISGKVAAHKIMKANLFLFILLMPIKKIGYNIKSRPCKNANHYSDYSP